MDRIVKIGSKEIGLRATALTPRLYRFKIGRDIIVDLNSLRKAYEKASGDEESQLSVTNITIFENVSFIMARQYNPAIPSTPEEWLDSMDEVFTIYELLPDILELWQLNQETTATLKKG